MATGTQLPFLSTWHWDDTERLRCRGKPSVSQEVPDSFAPPVGGSLFFNRLGDSTAPLGGGAKLPLLSGAFWGKQVGCLWNPCVAPGEVKCSAKGLHSASEFWILFQWLSKCNCAGPDLSPWSLCSPCARVAEVGRLRRSCSLRLSAATSCHSMRCLNASMLELPPWEVNASEPSQKWDAFDVLHSVWCISSSPRQLLHSHHQVGIKNRCSAKWCLPNFGK